MEIENRSAAVESERLFENERYFIDFCLVFIKFTFTLLNLKDL